MHAKCSTGSARPPAAEDFAAYPASWYLFCASGQLKDKPFSQRILGRQLVAYRKASGQVAVIHNWRYGADGVCTSIPHAAQIPAFARLRTYPVVERHGSVFFFNGREPLFPLPFILGADPADFVAGKTFRYVADCNWFMNSAHAFDTQHFAAVHDRRLLAPPSIDCPAPFARRNSYQAEVIGQTIFDRILRVVAGRTVNITLTIWGGNMAVITAAFDRVRSGFLMDMRPLENGQTLCLDTAALYSRLSRGRSSPSAGDAIQPGESRPGRQGHDRIFPMGGVTAANGPHSYKSKSERGFR